MNDRVIFGSVNDTDTPTASSGFNGFTGPKSPTGTIGLHPFSVAALPLTEAIRWFWRVQTWSLATDFEANGTLLDNGVMAYASTREMDLLTVSRLDYAIGSGDATASLLMFQAGTLYLQNATDYHPWITITGSVSNGFDSAFSFTTDDSGGFDGSLTATIAGFAIPLYYTILTTPGPITATVFALTPASYWPYAALDGSPIYDSITGATLQNPTN